MNKNRFRIIFNAARGAMMAVAEFVKSNAVSAGSTDASSSVNDRQNQTTPSDSPEAEASIRPFVFSIMLALGLVCVVVYIAPAHAEIIADQTAPANLRPVIINASNGVPLVNIQTPSAAGVSRNIYSQFDVNNNGAILNNSRTNVQTQLGGFVQGNPYLATGTARIILNEVNSHNPSLLNGYVEVAGSRAQVVIANPAGISCNGCGFINASRATLTTGTPILNSGDLIGYRVGGGTISLLGAGLDASQTDYTDIIARAVEVNAGIWSNHLNIIAGSNQVNVASNGDATGITPISPNATLPDGSSNPTPSFAIDVAALGGMYANKIHLIGTEAGLGVNNTGTIAASAGEITLTNDGLLINTCKITSTTQTTINAQDVTNTGGTVSAGQQLTIGTNHLTGDGKLLSGGDTTLTHTSDYTNTSAGELQADGHLTLTTTGNGRIQLRSATLRILKNTSFGVSQQSHYIA